VRIEKKGKGVSKRPARGATRLEQSAVARTHEVARVDANENTASLGALANLLDRLDLALPLDGDSDVAEGLLDELLDGVSLSGGENEVIGLVLLKHPPHSLRWMIETLAEERLSKKASQAHLDVVLGVSPVALGLEVTEVLLDVES